MNVTKNVSLTPELDHFIDEQVESGLYETASEVVREGLRLLRHRDGLRKKQLEHVKAKIEEGWQQSERGETVDGEAVIKRLRKKYDDRTRRRA